MKNMRIHHSKSLRLGTLIILAASLFMQQSAAQQPAPPQAMDKQTPAPTAAGNPHDTEVWEPVPPVVTAEGDAAGTGPADSSAAIPPNWRIEERDNVRLSVQDHGVGIPARDLDRIFERFYRVDHGRSRDTGGTGLGLSIVRHVANNHQGWVDVESREGEGSTFTLVLPIQAERVA